MKIPLPLPSEARSMEIVCVFINCSNLVRNIVSSLSSVDIPGKMRGSETAAGASACFTRVNPSVSCTLSCATQKNIRNTITHCTLLTH